MCSTPKKPQSQAPLPMPQQAEMPRPVLSPEYNRRAPGLSSLRIRQPTAPSL